MSDSEEINDLIINDNKVKNLYLPTEWENDRDRSYITHCIRYIWMCLILLFISIIFLIVVGTAGWWYLSAKLSSLTSFPDNSETVRLFAGDRIDPLTAGGALWTPSNDPKAFFEEYRTWDEYVAFIDDLCNVRFPEIASQSVMGHTIEGRAIPVIKLSTGGKKKLGFYIQALEGAREWLSNSATLYILNELAEGYDYNHRITNILENINIYIVPTVNIDGYIYSYTENNMWRKNRRINDGTTCIGVDLSRNYDGPSEWCGAGASSNQCSEAYCGTKHFSEPETAATSQFILDSSNNIGAALDMSAYGQYVLWPWGYTTQQLPAKYYDEFEALGSKIQTAIQDVHGLTFTTGQMAKAIYTKSGSMVDFAWESSGYKIFSFEIEGRGSSFQPHKSNIIPAGEEQLPAVLTLAESLID